MDTHRYIKRKRVQETIKALRQDLQRNQMEMGSEEKINRNTE